MFDELTYVGYNAIFCLPPLILLWLRKEFFEILCPRLKTIVLSTLILTVYGSLIWPVALKYGAWAYGADRITNVKFLGYVYIDDIMWWAMVSALFSSAVVLGVHYERQGVDIFWREVQGLYRSFLNAFRGFRVIPLERNSTIHVAAAAFVLLEAVFFRISAIEWLIVAVIIAAVLAFEIFNSAIERLASRTSAGTGLDPEIALIKDASAAGVLVSAVAATVIGMTIFFSRVVTQLL
jgi:diacylglycerol kinase